MNIPNWVFLTAYLTGAAWLLTWEVIAVWFDKERGDTITEFTRALAQSPPAWYALAALLFWFIDHFLLHDAIFRFLWNLGR